MEPPRNPALPPRQKARGSQHKRGYYGPRRAARTNQESWSSQLSCQALAISIFDHISEAGISTPSWPAQCTGAYNSKGGQRWNRQKYTPMHHHAHQGARCLETMPGPVWGNNPNRAYSSGLNHNEWPQLQYCTLNQLPGTGMEFFDGQGYLSNTAASSQQQLQQRQQQHKQQRPRTQKASAATVLTYTHSKPFSDALQPSSQGMHQESLLRRPGKKVVPGRLLSLQCVSFLTDGHMKDILDDVERRIQFRQFAGRAIMDVKLNGTAAMPALDGPYSGLNPLLAVMVELAWCSLPDGHELALVQLIVNHFKNGGNEVRPHTHRCRQVCVSLGVSRDVIVEGSVLQMKHGDCLPLAGEVHSVPPATGLSASRISVCLFYGSSLEFAQGTLCVNATSGKFGNSHWWVHPEDMRREAAVEDVSCSGLGSPSPATCYSSSLDGHNTLMPTGASDLMYGAATWRHADLAVPNSTELKPQARVWRGKKRPEADAQAQNDPFIFQ